MSDAKPKGIDGGLTNYGDPEFASFLRRSMARSMGVSRELLDKPVVGIAVTPSDFNNCHRHVPELAEAVARGVLAAGALPRTFPTVSLGEVFLNPTRPCLQTRIGWRKDGAFSRAAHDAPCRRPVKSAPKLDRSWAITSERQFADTP